jgi:hypothetical protein
VPFRQDYIERLIQKLAESIARALGVARSGQPDEGVAILEGAIASGFGLPLAMLLKLTPDTVRSLVGIDRAPALAGALRAHAEVLKLAGRDVDARASERLASELERER